MKNLLCLLLLIAISACSETGNNKSYELVPTDKKVSFALDTHTAPKTRFSIKEAEDGLYISCSHPSNESYTDDEICFQRFELREIDS